MTPKPKKRKPAPKRGSSGGGGRGGAKPRKRTPARRRGPSSVASQPAPGADAGNVRLQKVLAAAGVASRRKAEQLMLDGHVCVNGRVVRELGTRVHPVHDRVTVHGKPVSVERKVYFVLNKPDGVVCSAEGVKDERGRATVLSLLRGVPERIYPVGRLDFHTRGVLIMTNDGELSAALTHPRHEVSKTYHVKFQGKLSLAALEALGRGVTLEDGTITKPAVEVSVVRETESNTWVQLTIRQGLYRQIRRMGEAIDHPVLKLIRVAIGGLTADGLDDGEYRALTVSEVYDLRSLCGLA